MTTDAVPPFPPPQPPPAPPPGAPQTGATASPTSDERTMALLAHVLGIVAGFLGPLIVWLVKRNESAYVNHHGREALNFQLTVLIAAAAMSVLMCIPIVNFFVIGGVFALSVLNLVFCILAAVKANEGEQYRYPIAIRFVS